ncbi:MAG: exosortase-associated EpsI family protein [Acidobacteriota bacterium]
MNQSLRSKWVLASAALLFATVYAHLPSPSESSKINVGRLGFSGKMTPWRCWEAGSSFGSYDDPHVDQKWSGFCQAGADGPMELFVGFAARQTGRMRILSPALTFPGNILKSDVVRLTDEEGRVFAARQIICQQAARHPQALLFWYQIGSNSYASEYWYRGALFVRRFVSASTTAAVVRIASPLLSDNESAVLEAQKSLARPLFSHISAAFERTGDKAILVEERGF